MVSEYETDQSPVSSGTFVPSPVKQNSPVVTPLKELPTASPSTPKENEIKVSSIVLF